MFVHLLDHIKYEVTTILFKVQVRQEEDVQAIDEQRQAQAPKEMHFEHAEASSLETQPEMEAEAEQKKSVSQPYVRSAKVGRNEPCPCGSGKKYKHCHGKLS